MNGLNEKLAGNRLMQACRAADLLGFPMVLHIFERRDKNDGNFCAHFNQPAAQVESGHAAELNVQHQAVDRFGEVLQEGLSGTVNLRSESSRPQQPPNGPGKAFVVIHHRDTDFVFIHTQIDLG